MPKEVEIAFNNLPESIDFNFHVKPILSDRCYSCHGPDENTRKAGLRLDIEENAFAKLSSGNYAFVSGNARQSESVYRILNADPEIQMPPPDSHLTLNAQEKAIIIKWIQQGAQWKDHWAFISPEKPDIPILINKTWPSNNAIDKFVQKKLAIKGFEPTHEANKERLIRRITMDLTGLPPTIPEIDAFLSDTSVNAYEKVVDRLLDTDAYAERMAVDWMDVSRYADSHGLHADGWRLMWPWRDWVINAFKENMPYDQFITWQLAGDLLPNASKDQKLATAFNRNHPMTAEGGAIEEEFRLNYVWDRTETVGTALLGLTINCARCHDHKFDPITQKDYYELTAFFNNVKELGMTGDDGNYGPMLALPKKETEDELKSLDYKIQEKERQLELTIEELMALETYMRQLPGDFNKRGLLGYYPMNSVEKSDKQREHIIDGNKMVTSTEAPAVTKGVTGNALEFTGEYDEVYLKDIPNFEWTNAFSSSLWINTTKREAGRTQTLLGTAGDKNNYWRGWEFYLDSLNYLNARLIHSLPHNYIHVRSKDSLQTNSWYNVAFTYNGSGKAKGLKLFINGRETEQSVGFDNLYKSIKTITGGAQKLTNRPVMVAKSYRAFTGENGIFLGRIDDVHLFSRVLTSKEIAKLYDQNQDFIIAPEYWVTQASEVKSLDKELQELRSEWLKKMIPVMEVMVMEEMPEARQAYAYNRGDYEQPIYKVDANTPHILPEFSEKYPKNRLGLSQWIFAPENPLTARVTVNRLWQMLFGKGLVNTPQDFGVQGALPSHPELLDWLATTFVESGWDTKKLIKIIVLSHTYKQSSQFTKDMLEKDPYNYYLARSNSYRLPAEMIRDNALKTSGLLVRDIGGESVKPYQPEGLWIEKSSFSHKLMNYKESGGDSLYRRGLYTFIRRTSPHPAMIAFDAPNREVCIIKRENTNTPLQALVLMNDVQFVEASKMLAVRMQKEGGDSLDQQIRYGFRLTTSRHPKEEETKVLKDLYNSQSQWFTSNKSETLKFLKVGNKKLEEGYLNSKTAALAMVANTLLNHDETYMKR
ncbi:MAG: DUF1553 domain-containing protein [Eudoraea sp.]